MLPVALTCPAVAILPPVMLPAALAVPPVSKLPPVIVPDALSTPVMYSPVVANTATFGVPATVIKMLPLATAAMLLLPDVIGKPAEAALTPVNCEPLPK